MRILVPQQMRSRRKILLVLAILTIFSCIWRKSHENDRYPRGRETSVGEQHNNIPTTTEDGLYKEIVIWTPFFGNMNVWNDIFKRLTSESCEESRCIISFDHEHTRTADAVLFNAYDLSLMTEKTMNMPEVRNPSQIYIFYSMESPARMNGSIFKSFGNYFNWTMTYRRDSDVVEPFGLVTKRILPRRRHDVHFVSQRELRKKKHVVWMASHCDTTAYRHSYIQQLKRFINVQIYGLCGKVCDNGLSFGVYGKEIGFSSCEKKMSKYAFYLAFENSFCNDYVTEKIYKAWTLGVIPVVMGAVNYSAIAPPKSFIDTRDFETPWKLAEYLKKVASDEKLYNEYFEWKLYYDFEVGSPYNALTCDLCKKLHSHDSYQKSHSYPDIVDWFFNKSNCVYGF